MNTVDCGPACCTTVPPVQVPGLEGDAGLASEDGSNGVSAYTIVLDDFIIPAIGSNVTVTVASSVWMVVGQKIFVGDGTDSGYFEVVSKPGVSSVVLQFLGYADDSAPGATIDAGAGVSPGGTQPALSAALPTALTDNSTGTASDTIAAGVGIFTLIIPLTSLATGLSTLAIDLLTDYVLGYRFKLLSFDFVTTIVGAGAGASQTFNLEINAANVTGGSLNVTLGSTDTIGKITVGSAITAANVGTAANTISIEMAAGGTVFSDGGGYFVIKVQNMDTADSIASLADHINDVLTALTP